MVCTKDLGPTKFADLELLEMFFKVMILVVYVIIEINMPSLFGNLNNAWVNISVRFYNLSIKYGKNAVH